MKSDSQIQREVFKELHWDTRVEATHVGVEVERGVVTLTGSASSWAKKVAAERAAFRVAGVMDIANEISIKPIASVVVTDTEIAEAVRQALKWDVFVPEQRIAVAVWDGVVTLTGQVDFATQRDDAARAIEHLAGVHAVNNKLSIDQPAIPPEALRTAIEEALERRADRELKKLHFDVAGNQVTISGLVSSIAERRAVVGTARGTRGVDSVVDKLRVQLPTVH